MGSSLQVHTSLKEKESFSYANVKKASYRGCMIIIDKTLKFKILHPSKESFRDLHAVWSTLIGRGMSRLGSHWSRVMLAPALLCHKEPARRIQSPLLGALERKIPPLGGILLAPRWFFMA